MKRRYWVYSNASYLFTLLFYNVFTCKNVILKEYICKKSHNNWKPSSTITTELYLRTAQYLFPTSGVDTIANAASTAANGRPTTTTTTIAVTHATTKLISIILLLPLQLNYYYYRFTISTTAATINLLLLLLMPL